MDNDFCEWSADAPLRTPDGFSEAATAVGVAASVAERNEMLAYACRTFGHGHGQLLERILSGYQKARKLRQCSDVRRPRCQHEQRGFEKMSFQDEGLL